MYRTLTVVVTILVCLPTTALPAAIIVIPQKDAYNWVVSKSRMFDKDSPTSAGCAAELVGYFKTLAAAKQEAARLQRFDQMFDSDPFMKFDKWRLRKIYIEGADAPSGPPADAAPKTPSLFDKVQSGAEKVKGAKDKYDDAKWGMKLLTDPDEATREKGAEWQKKFAPGSVLKEYADNVKGAYARVKELKDPLLKLEKNAMEKSFKNVNDAVAKYNQEADAGAKFFNSKSNPFPKLTPVGPQTAKAVDEWKDALKQQFALEQRKDDLDKRKADMDRKRENLADDWKALQNEIKPFDATNPKVVRLRGRLKEYTTDVEHYNTSLTVYKRDTEKLSGSLIKKPETFVSPDKPQPKMKLYYIVWTGNKPNLPGYSNREDEVARARYLLRYYEERLGIRIKVTEHLASPTMTGDAISNTPGKTIFDRNS